MRVCRASLKTVAGYYQYREHLNSSVVECNELGQVISYEEYYPYGRSAYRAAASGVNLSLKRYRFTGKERDEETGLDYFGVRYYASWLGRWTSSDPGGFVDGLNLYRYVRNNPVNGIDNLGYETDPPKYTKVSQTEGGSSVYKDNTYKDAYKVITGSGSEYYRNAEGRYWHKHDGQWVEQDIGMMKEVGIHQELNSLISGASQPSETFSFSPPTSAPAPQQPLQTVPEESRIENISTGSFIGDMILGEVPGIGTSVDLTNAAIDFHNGDYVMAVLNAAAALPILGLLFGSIAKSIKIARAIDKAVDATDLSKYGDNLNETITFYHGTSKETAAAIRKNGVSVDSKFTRPDADFGRGFYTSTNIDLARRSPVGRVPGVNSLDDVDILEFEIPVFEFNKMNNLSFGTSPNSSWMNFTKSNKVLDPTLSPLSGKNFDSITGRMVRRISDSKGVLDFRTFNFNKKEAIITPAMQTSFNTPRAANLLNVYMKF